MAQSGLETELKFAVDDLGAIRERLQAAGGTRIRPPVFEENLVFDDALGSLFRRGELLRLRRGDDVRLTWKQSVPDRRFKVQHELEVRVDDFGTMQAILGGLGFSPVRRYEREREVWRRGNAEIALDRTPIGPFVEVEAEPAEMEATASALGLDLRRASRLSYLDLYTAYCRERGREPGDMVFE